MRGRGGVTQSSLTVGVLKLLKEALQLQLLILGPQDDLGPFPIQAGVSPVRPQGKHVPSSQFPPEQGPLPPEVLDAVGQAHPYQMVDDLLACPRDSPQVCQDDFYYVLTCGAGEMGQ